MLHSTFHNLGVSLFSHEVRAIKVLSASLVNTVYNPFAFTPQLACIKGNDCRECPPFVNDYTLEVCWCYILWVKVAWPWWYWWVVRRKCNVCRYIIMYSILVTLGWNKVDSVFKLLIFCVKFERILKKGYRKSCSRKMFVWKSRYTILCLRKLLRCQLIMKCRF